MRPPVAARGALLVALALLAYSGALTAGFVYDDKVAVQQNPVIRGEVPFHELLSRDFWGVRPSAIRTWRPVAVATLTGEWRLTNGSPAALHALSIALHALLMLISYLVWRRIVGEDVAWVGALLLSMLVGISEVPLTLVGQADILAALFVMLGLAAHRSTSGASIPLAALCLALAIGSKESAVMAPFAWVLLDGAFPPARRHWPMRLGAYAIAVAGMLGLRALALGAQLPIVNRLMNPLEGASLLARWLGAGRIFLVQYWGSVLVPTRWQYDCSWAACLPGKASDPLAWTGLALALGLALVPLVAWKRSPLLAAGTGWFLLFFAPTSNFLILSVAAYGSRWFYLPLVGISFIAAAGLRQAAMRWHRPALLWAFTGAILLLNAISLQDRISAWSSPMALAQAGLRYGAESAFVQAQVATAYIELGDGESALPYARRAIEIAPDYPAARETLAVALDLSGHPAEAEAAFRAALAQGGAKTAYVSFGTFLARRGRLREALEVVRAGLTAPEANPSSLVRLRERLEQDLRDGASPDTPR